MLNIKLINKLKFFLIKKETNKSQNNIENLLNERLKKRDNQSETLINQRFKRFELEMSYKEKFKYHFINDNFNSTTNEIEIKIMELIK